MSKHRRFVGFICLASTCLIPATVGQCDEPARRFLERLREEGLTEIGLKYLEVGEKRNRFPESFRKDIPLERILLQKESLPILQRQSPQQFEERRANLEAGLKGFISSNANHPRRSEAQGMLADLLVGQGRMAFESSKKEPTKASEQLSKARASFSDAIQLFGQSIAELAPKITELRGERAKTAEQIELRRQYQIEYRQAQLLEAKTMQEIGETYEANSPEWKEWLGKAEKKLADLVDKTNLNSEAGTRMLSLLYRGEVQAKLGNNAAARDSFTRVSDIGGDGGVLREWKIQSIAHLIRLDIEDKPPKFDAAIKRGVDALELVKSRGNQERKLPHWIDLQMALCEARIAWGATIDKVKEDGKYKGNLREAREMLQDLLKIKGVHQDKVKKYLSEIGIEAKSAEPDEKLPDPKDFEEALNQGRLRVTRAEDGLQALELLKEQGGSDEEPRAQIKKDRLQAIERLQRAVTLFRDSDSRVDLLDAKFLIAYLYYNTDQFWNCAAISESIIRTDEGTEQAKQAGKFALASMSRIMESMSPDDQTKMLLPFEKLAKALMAKFPDSDTGVQAADVLVRAAIINKKYDEAEKFIAMTGGKGGNGASVLGQLLWRDFQLLNEEHRKNKTEPSPSDLSLRQRAEKLLDATWKEIDPGKVDKNLMMGVNALANIYLTTDRIAEAEVVILNPERGARKLLETAVGLDAGTQLEVFKLQLQSMVQSASKPGGNALDPKTVGDLVGRMKELATGDSKLLTNALKNLAFSIQSKIESATSPEDQARIGKSLGVLVGQLVNVSDDIGVLDSAGSAANVLATSLQNTAGLKDLSKELFVVADEAYTKVASRPKDELVAANKNPDEIQIRVATAKSGAGKHEGAHDLLREALTKSNANISLQILAANNLQKWSSGTDVELLRKAAEGSDPGANGKNLVWGWGAIAGRISKDPNGMTKFQDRFFDAKYHDIDCKKLIALNAPDIATKTKYAKLARDDFRVLSVRYPEFGSPDFKAKFQKLEAELNALPK